MADVDSTGSPQEDTSQAPASAAEAVAAPTEPETPQSKPTSEAPQPETQTAQIPASEPLPPEPPPSHEATEGQSEPIAPTPAPEPPQAASTPVTPAPASINAPQATHPARDLLVKARATIQDRKHKKLEKILEALTAKGKITNDEVEKLLHVSDATATRYLSALEKEGKIQQVGKTGKAVE